MNSATKSAKVWALIVVLSQYFTSNSPSSIPIEPIIRLPPGYSLLSIHVFGSLVQHVRHIFQVLLVDREEKISRLKSVGEGDDQDFIVGFVD